MSNTIFSSRKGVSLLLSGIFFLIIVLGIIFTLTPTDESEEIHIGAKQYDLLIANEKASAADLYIHKAVDLASSTALNSFFKNDGVFKETTERGMESEHECGRYLLPVFAKDSNECVPAFRETYKAYFDLTLDRKLYAYPDYPLSFRKNLDFSLDGERTSVLLTSENAVKIPVVSDSELRSGDSMSGSYPTGVLGGYGNEKIVECATPECAKDIADYYYNLYTEFFGNLPYVWGGESPYTYKDTVALQQEGSSFFDGVWVSRTEPGRTAFTKPGFDCSGWIWWVGKHANVDLLEGRKSAHSYFISFKNDNDKAKPICGDDSEMSCSLDNILSEAKAGDILFSHYQDGMVTHIMLYAGNDTVIHSRGSKGLVKEQLPRSYFRPRSKIRAVYRLKDAAFEGKYESLEDYFMKSQTAQSNVTAESGKDACVLPVDFTQINDDAIDSTRITYTELQKKINQHDLEGIIEQASTKYQVPAPYIKAIITTEVGGEEMVDEYFSGETTVSGSGMRGPMQLSKDACDTLNNNEELTCRYNEIEQGDIEHAIFASTAFIALLRDTAPYIDKDNPDYYLLSLAYNAGPESLKNIMETASERTGLDPSNLNWRDITYEDIKTGMGELDAEWAHDQAKWKEVHEYPNLVVKSLSQQCKGNPFMTQTNNYVSLEPSAEVTVDANFNTIDHINTFIERLIECDDDLENCVQDTVSEFNDDYLKEEVVSFAPDSEQSTPVNTRTVQTGINITTPLSQQTISSDELFAKRFLKQLLDCSSNTQSDCVCKLEVNTSRLKQEKLTLNLNWAEEYVSKAEVKINGQQEESISLPPLTIALEEDTVIAPDEINFIFHSKDEGGEFIIDIPGVTKDRYDYDFFKEHQLALHKHFSFADFKKKNNPYKTELIQADTEKVFSSQTESADEPLFELFETAENLHSTNKDLFRNIDDVGDDIAENACGDVVSYAKKYLGTAYGGTGVCTPEDAQAEACTTQCGSYITNVFRGSLGEPVHGDGKDKCKHPDVNSNVFYNPERLEPGDIFSSDGRSDAAQEFGHTGIYVGKGHVSDPAKESWWGSYSYKTFTPDPAGEHVFIHSIGPVSYNTLSQLISPQMQGRNLYSFCRHDSCKQSQDELLPETSKSGMTLFAIEKENEKEYLPFMCRDTTDTFLFTAQFPLMEGQSIGFSAQLEDTTPPDEIITKEAVQASCSGSPSIMFTWEDDDDDVYGYNITVWPEEKSEQEGITYIVPRSHAVQTDTATKDLKVLHRPLVSKSGNADTYVYMVGTSGETPLFEINKTYSYLIRPLDNHLNVAREKVPGSIKIEDPNEELKSLSKLVFKNSHLDTLIDSGAKLFEGSCSDYHETLSNKKTELLGSGGGESET